MGDPDDGLVAKVNLPSKISPAQAQAFACRKLFGDSTKDSSTGAGKHLQITTKTTYRLMKKQKQQGTDGGGEQEGEGQVCAKRHLTARYPLTTL
jgi:hypothetical protein